MVANWNQFEASYSLIVLLPQSVYLSHLQSSFCQDLSVPCQGTFQDVSSPVNEKILLVEDKDQNTNETIVLDMTGDQVNLGASCSKKD